MEKVGELFPLAFLLASKLEYGLFGEEFLLLGKCLFIFLTIPPSEIIIGKWAFAAPAAQSRLWTDKIHVLGCSLTFNLFLYAVFL